MLYPASIHSDDPLRVEGFQCTSGDFGKHARIVRCAQCGHVYASPRWTAKKLMTAYTDVEDQTYVEEEEGRVRTFRSRCRELACVTGPAHGRSLLDVGAYTGIFVQEALKMGWKAQGIELSQWCVNVARSRGLPVVQSTLDAIAQTKKSFDVLTLWDVIEHMDDPAKEVRTAKNLLAPGGFLVIHTMDIGSLCARMMRGRWPWFIGMHLHFFSKRTLCALLRREGFTIIKAGASGRTLFLGYFADQLAGLFPVSGRFLSQLVHTLHMDRIPLRLNFGDLITVYAKKGV